MTYTSRVVDSKKEGRSVSNANGRLEYELTPKLQRELLNHPGKWVAVSRSRLLAIGDTPAEVLRVAREQHPRASAILRHISDAQHVAYF
jgi:hypothetical protein